MLFVLRIPLPWKFASDNVSSHPPPFYCLGLSPAMAERSTEEEAALMGTE